MKDNQGIIDIIFSRFDNFSESEKKVAKYIMNNKENVIEMTIAELSAASSVSEASVSRFCRKCNAKSFHHLKITLAKEIVESGENIVPASSDVVQSNIEQSLQNILANKTEELKQTVSLIKKNEFSEIISLLQNVRTVQFAAVGNTIPVALDGTYKFNQIGIPSVSNIIWETQLAYTFNLSNKDAVIIISNSGASKRLLTVAEAANGLGATTIAITNSEKSPLAQICKYHITTATREKLFLDEYYFSRIAAFFVVEALYLFLTVGKDDVYKNLSRHEQSIADDKI